MNEYHRLEKCRAAYAALQWARDDMLTATKAAWPIGMQVISNKFHRGPIECTVTGHRDFGSDIGSLQLLNNRSGKTHQAWPYTCHSGVWGVVPV